MTIERTDNEFGSATAGGATVAGGDNVGGWQGGAPEFMLSLIGCFCHKEELFCCDTFRIASESPKQGIAKTVVTIRPRGRAAIPEGKNYAIPP
jgi:hypothetical protein